jgi:hypothetical protein
MAGIAALRTQSSTVNPEAENGVKPEILQYAVIHESQAVAEERSFMLWCKSSNATCIQQHVLSVSSQEDCPGCMADYMQCADEGVPVDEGTFCRRFGGICQQTMHEI